MDPFLTSSHVGIVYFELEMLICYPGMFLKSASSVPCSLLNVLSKLYLFISYFLRCQLFATSYEETTGFVVLLRQEFTA